MSRTVFFAGGGTGGHIYPGLAVAEKLKELDETLEIHFFCSDRAIDSDILSSLGFDFTVLGAREFSVRPGGLVRFLKGFKESEKQALGVIKESSDAVVVGVGGFVAAPVCRAAVKAGKPVKLINVDIIPGKANKLAARWVDEIFVQFEDTGLYFRRHKADMTVTGCPLRKGFEMADGGGIREKLGLEKSKKILLVTGASSGARSVNEAITANLDNLERFGDSWQIVHLAGKRNYREVTEKYRDVTMAHKVVDYCEDMAGLLAAADLVVGRSGAVSVAEYAAADVPVICMPYPYHKDRHQYLNAGKLVEDGGAVIVDDLPEVSERAKWLWQELRELMSDDARRQAMVSAEKRSFSRNASEIIAKRLLI